MTTNSFPILWEKAIIGLAEVDKYGRFVKANPAFCDLVGYSESELQNKKWQDITHPDDTEGGERMFSRIVSGQISNYTMEKRYITKRGLIVWVNISMSGVLDPDGNTHCVLKQVINLPIQLSDFTPKKDPVSIKDTIKENIKVVLASIVGIVFTLYGAWHNEPDLKNIGLALVLGLFGGLMAKK